MIGSIDLKNYETHLDTVIDDLHPGVNVFTGESDEGKSGIVRALTLNAQNRPMGTEYRNDNLDPKDKKDKAKETQVGVVYKGSGLVIRSRDGIVGGINHYQIDTQEPLRALRTDVPDEVQEVTRMKSVNIQGQHPTEQYFLLADKPGQVAKEFNKVSGLTVMDKTLADINAQVRECNSSITIAKKEIETKEEELKETEWVPKAEKFAKKLQAFKVNMDAVIKEQHTLKTILFQIATIDGNLTHFKGVGEAKIALGVLETQKSNIISKEKELNTILTLLSDIKSVDIALSDCLHTDKALNTLKMLEKFKADIKEDEQKVFAIKNILLELKMMDEKICFAETDYTDAVVLFNELKETTDCPVCGRSGK